MPLKFKQHIEDLFKKSTTFSDANANLDINAILEAIDKIDAELIKILLSDAKAKESFFTQVEAVYVLEQNKLIEFFTQNDYMKNGSFTSYTNKIGLIRKDNFIKKFDDVVLAWPHKDCILEGGQTKDDEKNKETFYNEILSSEEIERLFEPKALTNIKRYCVIANEVKQSTPEVITENDNLIIKGNNLLALHSLKKKYTGKVKLIYIDPPYNTGNDSFKYNDNFNHSTWLTFMKNRLEVAREFLSDDGAIFVNIDQNESHYLKILLDEVFGINNFINEIIWAYGTGGNYEKSFSKKHDNIFLYSKNKEQLKFFKEQAVIERDICEACNSKITKRNNLKKHIDEDGRIYRTIKSAGKIYKYYDDEPVALSDIWYLGQMQQKDPERVGFNSQKPEKLLERIILSLTTKNDLVMDFHLGSGTTCAVAHKMGRRYIGIEQMDYIEDIAVERMKKVIAGEQGGISKSVEWSGGGSFVYAELKEIENFKDAEIGKLNKTMKYLPISEIEDAEYGVCAEEIKINKAFYGVDDE